ncbi:M23 family metallopeptidase [Paenibacillus cremeus]|uniref:M23 family metallopeptidase n=1 Tax=Paenibacillus cremeus TaxID=2163881 RepID=A0A559KHS0_9BACL|nr:M23 family metallopeptidase [Paenibacillus cremeus]TVY11666.1 M23 family metallopeptidase [Paenibacillus cremeus]
MKDSGQVVRKTLEVIQWILALTMIVAVVVSGRLLVKTKLPVPANRYDVFLDDANLGTVSDPEVVMKWKAMRYEEISRQNDGLRVTSNLERLRFEPSHNPFHGMFDNDAVFAALSDRIMIAVLAAEVRVNGEAVGLVKDAATAEALLAKIQAPFIAKEKSSASEASFSTGFVQNVQIVETAVAPGKIEAPDAVLERIHTGNVQPVEYEVQKGDCISLIAQQFKISPDAIYTNNPGIKNDIIHIGDVLNLTVLQPLLTVKIVETRTEQQKIPSSIVYEKDDELRAGVLQIKSQGKPGKKEVTIQTISVGGQTTEKSELSETILESPEQTVVRQGTKVVAGIGSGSFISPVLRAKITSEFGARWGTTHNNGTDLVSEQRAILASDHGKVTFAGVKSGYGNCIIIDHQNGFETLYGHLSKIEVSQGEAVRKGDRIGVMGSTGNATGVHLHFEIIQNGHQQNPMKYLQL